MKNYTITVNGKVYEVTVEEGFTGQGEKSGTSPAPTAAPKSAAAGKEPAAAPKAAPAPAVAAAVEEAEEMDDTELVAVIAAAIAAAEGTTTDGFVVRSIKRRKSNKWNA